MLRCLPYCVAVAGGTDGGQEQYVGALQGRSAQHPVAQSKLVWQLRCNCANLYFLDGCVVTLSGGGGGGGGQAVPCFIFSVCQLGMATRPLSGCQDGWVCQVGQIALVPRFLKVSVSWASAGFNFFPNGLLVTEGTWGCDLRFTELLLYIDFGDLETLCFM